MLINSLQNMFALCHDIDFIEVGAIWRVRLGLPPLGQASWRYCNRTISVVSISFVVEVVSHVHQRNCMQFGATLVVAAALLFCSIRCQLHRRSRPFGKGIGWSSGPPLRIGVEVAQLELLEEGPPLRLGVVAEEGTVSRLSTGPETLAIGTAKAFEKGYEHHYKKGRVGAEFVCMKVAS